MTNFASDQLRAAEAFAQTMIVVDDEARTQPKAPEVVGKAGKPTRKTATQPKIDSAVNAAKPKSHPLDAKTLVDIALDQGLVCSVVRPKRGEAGVPVRISKAANRADIVSVDWQMNGEDSGDLAVNIISSILQNDFEVGGRLRLISIYTGQRNSKSILESTIDKLPDALIANSNVRLVNDAIISDYGLKLIVLYKGEEIKTGVKINELPKRLLLEFSKLSDGMLSNIALATIAEIRKTTHHLVRKFGQDMDGNYLHHQALLEEPSNAKDYATALIMSEMKSEIDAVRIGQDYLSADNIKNWLKNIFSKLSKVELSHRQGDAKIMRHSVEQSEVENLLSNGIRYYYPAKVRKSFDDTEQEKWKSWPNEETVKKSFSSIFFEEHEQFEKSILEFSFLSSNTSSELSNVHKKTMPKLDLGSIICQTIETEINYYLCLQASCDTVRSNEGDFFFIPLEIATGSKISHVASHRISTGEERLISLSVPKKAYTKSCSICFGVINKKLGGIQAHRKEDSDNYWFKDIEGQEYRWLANMKKRRALKIAQTISKDMSRIGFDEFEPHRVGE